MTTPATASTTTVRSFLSHFISIAHASSFVTAISDLEKTVGADYIKDGNIKDALLDTAITYLTSLKTSTNSGTGNN